MSTNTSPTNLTFSVVEDTPSSFDWFAEWDNGDPPFSYTIENYNGSIVDGLGGTTSTNTSGNFFDNQGTSWTFFLLDDDGDVASATDTA